MHELWTTSCAGASGSAPEPLSAHLLFGTATAATYWLLTTVEMDR